jgi:hypothetical protein
MWIFKALWGAIRGDCTMGEMNKKVDDALFKESQGEDISPPEE